MVNKSALTAKTTFPENAAVIELIKFWQTRDVQVWKEKPELFRSLGEKFLESGEYILGYDVVTEGLGIWPDDSRMLELQVLSLARCGSPLEANRIAGSLFDNGHQTEELIGILGRTHKDLMLCAGDNVTAIAHLQNAIKLYELVSVNKTNYWGLINAATLNYLAGNVQKAREFSCMAISACTDRLTNAAGLKGAELYWIQATLGESELIAGNVDLAVDWYKKAIAHGGHSYGNLAATKRNLKLLADAGGVPCSSLESIFSTPCVCVFSGHLTDEDGRPEARFPEDKESQLYGRILKMVQELNVGIGYASAARGSDILFLEAVLAAGGEINIVLPYPQDEFITSSVAATSGVRWVERFHRLVDLAKGVTVASQYPGDGSTLAYGNLVLFGLAKAHSKQIDGSFSAITVWDGKAGPVGGTSSNLKGWLAFQQPVHVLHPLKDEPRYLTVEASELIESDLVTSFFQDGESNLPYKTQVVTFLFADVVGFSKLHENQITTFIEKFLGVIANLLERHGNESYRNTWGDGLFFVFDSPKEAGRLALAIGDHIKETNWVELGLPSTTNIRIALHCGPAYVAIDPITRRLNYFGSHVSRAARIEPITPPGEVYCSEAFAALCAAEDIQEFACAYVGNTPFAKNYGVFPTFRVISKPRRTIAELKSAIQQAV